ncbi:hypothetical protein TRIATDRAFT_259206 [Trichoderma atroviride IMI 206040]|uniref:Uncharacterized protein n=1 Tax=Hypocrea atroviridis (strain ATCC 20476 / IMI 206040) TaxID=452589 RepID=G9P516_HYPAI|nr:uncharacterized protein TRIATDRAFT_259206 [Trichoderma atroviride IMI 206040]EHK41256.1 hypothetical protein TRIATDRAFT_259206 [Trichoderma atroviride IMI 206040]
MVEPSPDIPRERGTPGTPGCVPIEMPTISGATQRGSLLAWPEPEAQVLPPLPLLPRA